MPIANTYYSNRKEVFYTMKAINSIRLQRLFTNEQIDAIRKEIELLNALNENANADPDIVSRVREVIDEYREYEQILSGLTDWAKSQVDEEEKKGEEN